MFAALLLASAAAALVEHNVTMRSTAAILTYSPYNTTADQGWNETYTLASWGEYNTGALPDGDGAQVTSFAGATVSVSWVGTGAYFHGTGGAVAVTVDGKETYSGPMGVVGVSNLAYAAHNATLSVTGGSVSVTNVTLTTIIGGDGAVDVDQDIVSLDDATNTNPALSVVGRWAESTTFCGSMENATWSSTSCERYSTLGTEQPGASLQMQVPANASIALMSGAVGSAHGAYSVILDPAPPHAPASQSFSAQRAWMASANLLFFASLDPAQRYTMRIQHKGSSDQVLEWGRARFIIAQGGEPWSPSQDEKGEEDESRAPESPAQSQDRSTIPIGAVVGGVLGGITIIILVAGILWRRCRHRPVHSGEKVPVGGGRKKWRRRPVSEFEVDVVDQTNQSGALGTYHPMRDPAQASADMIPDTAENRITPLPAPWPGDMVSYPSSSGKSGLSSPTSSAPHSYSYGPSAQSHAAHTFGAPGSVPAPHSNSEYSYPPKSPFADPPGVALSPSTSTQMHYPPSPVKGAMEPPPRPAIVTEAEDAGRVVEEQVPPRYNPAWAEDGPSGRH